MENKPLMQMLLDEGYPKEEIFHHASDLYVYKTPLTIKVRDEWMKMNGYHKGILRSSFLYSEFTDQVTGRRMFDFAFQYIGDDWKEG